MALTIFLELDNLNETNATFRQNTVDNPAIVMISRDDWLAQGRPMEVRLKVGGDGD